MPEIAYLCRPMQLRDLTDTHTHHYGRPDALLSLPPSPAVFRYAAPFSLELHPWHVAADAVTLAHQLDEFRCAADALRGNPHLLAIGECGLDNHCDVPLDRQTEAFRCALAVAHELDLPVVIHCVGYWAEMLRCVADANLKRDVIIHGFRKGPQLARQLLDAGLSIALGEKFNPDVARIIPSDRLFFETDESETDVLSIREKILNLRDSAQK
ncbi:MAG: TatD family hydrolase [Bacteroidales bacterium]|nr:TatD family hydrolase [Bacteroidales bacterium]